MSVRSLMGCFSRIALTNGWSIVNCAVAFTILNLYPVSAITFSLSVDDSPRCLRSIHGVERTRDAGHPACFHFRYPVTSLHELVGIDDPQLPAERNDVDVGGSFFHPLIDYVALVHAPHPAIRIVVPARQESLAFGQARLVHTSLPYMTKNAAFAASSEGKGPARTVGFSHNPSSGFSGR